MNINVEHCTTVKPLKRTYKDTSIYVVTDTELITEEGLILTYNQAIESMPWLHTTKDIVCSGTNLIPYLQAVEEHWQGAGNLFNIMAQPFFRERIVKGKKQRRIVSVKPCYFGFRNSVRRGAPYKQIHHLLDPLLFLNDSASSVSGLREQIEDNPYNLMKLIKDYRDICKRLNVPMVTNAASFGSMMLRHPNFFPKERKKVSSYINEVAAQAKVGQHEWRPDNRAKRTIVYALDQRRAHHTCAEDMAFPHSNTLRIRGNHESLEGFWKDLQDVLPSHGLLYINYTVPTTESEGIPTFPEVEHKGTYQAWVGTNEIRDWQSCGAEVNYVIAAITTRTIDTGLSDYATWVKADLEKQRPPYIATFAKMLYFRPYGLLGMRPSTRERYYYRCNSTDPNHKCYVRYEHVGQGLTLPFHIHQDETQREAPYVNQVWRAMLERESRRRVIMEARRLTFDKGKRIVGIFADSIYVRYPYLIESDEWIWKAEKQDVSFMERAMYEHRTGKLIAPGISGKGREQLVWEAQKLPLEQ